MGEKYLIDTNVIIDFAEDKLSLESKILVARIIDTTRCFSIINKIELLSLSDVNELIPELIDSSKVIALTEEIILKTIAIRKKKKIKLPDAIIAATSIVHSLVLVTRNISDFQNIKGLKLHNLWD